MEESPNVEKTDNIIDGSLKKKKKI